MSAVLPKLRAVPDPARTLDTLATILFVIVTIGILYLGREILVPIAIAILLSFVLSPLVKPLRKIGLGKTVSVGIVVFTTFLIATGVGVTITNQITDLAADAPKYQATVTRKVDAAKAFLAKNTLLAKLDALIADVDHMNPAAIQKKAKDKQAAAATPRGDRTAGKTDAKPPPPLPVQVVSPPPDIITVLRAAAATAAPPIAAAAFVAIFVIFVLLQREDLRNRFIRLAGSGDIQRTTLAMNDAAKRLSRYFLAQVLLNAGFGLVIAGALAALGVPGAILWGILAFILRFIPYVGSFAAAVLPILMAAASSWTWDTAIETAILFIVCETILGQAIEPLVYGHNTGLSPIAIVAAATFWTWLWGPVGLVLSTPLTVCLVVMGRHVERLSFLDVILGDAPALTPVEAFYQRMLVGDPSEIIDHADEFLRKRTLLEYCDEIAMKALLMAQEDVRRGALSEEQQSNIKTMLEALVEDLDDDKADDDDPKEDEAPASLGGAAEREEGHRSAPLPHPTIDPSWRTEAVLCVAGRTLLDEAAADLFVDLLTRRGIGARVVPPSSLTRHDASALAGPDTKLIVLSLLDADLNVAQARFAVRRLRKRVPNVPIVVAFWRAERDDGRTAALCGDLRCDSCVASLPEAMRLCLERAATEPVAQAA